MPLQQPTINIWGIRIDEPVTSLTALLISAICFYAFIKLGKIRTSNKTHIYLRAYFLIMAVATANGGLIGHAFLYNFSFAWKLIGWVISMISIMLIERASIEYASPFIGKKIGRVLKWVNLLELTIFITITILTLNFFFVESHTTYGLLIVVASLHFYVYRKTKSEASRLFLIAVGIAAISAIIYMNQWGISKWFNHSDISHVLLMVTAYLFYLGSAKIGNEKP